MSKISLDPKIEQEMVNAAKQNPDLFAPLYEHYHPHLLRFVQSKISQSEIAEDLTAQTFEKAIKNLSGFEWQDVSFSAWLYQIAKRLIIDHYRKSSRRQMAGSDEMELVMDNSSLENQVEDELASDSIRRLLATLPARERKVAYLKFYNGYSNKVIADLTDLSETNVGTILYRIVGRLRESLTGNK
ncbi:RNA polymerase sigma factor [Candidatus Dojkabacteria bacterium]|uniref:RNA polymerase sigma factor n=1 Tax=Candidatus Dojkabacteria bacterium TaxID=2099670 RepID=A0A955ID41_9BACT|nr:RNA polymerase sigma factor [Candidatus Dojkabacteria bacterium]